MDYAIINGKPMPAKDAMVSVADRGFRYGDGVFETIAVHRGKPYQLDWHIGRLTRGLAAIKIKNADSESLKQQCQKLLQLNKVDDGLLRIQITRGVGGRGYLPDKDAKPTVVIETTLIPHIPHAPVTLFVSSYEKISSRALPVTSKIAQGINSTLARLEAEEHACADALLLNRSGHICETSGANIFWLKDNVLYTPALSCGVLEGSIRAAIIRLSPHPVHEVSAPLDALIQAQAVFITNAAYKALPINWLKPNGMAWDSMALAQKMHDLIMNDMLG